jgi:uncharacterized protein YjiK
MLCYQFRIICVALLLFLFGCKKTNSPEGDTLLLLAHYPLSLSEASGLSYYSSDDRLLTTSDLTGRIYIISTHGEVLDSLSFKGIDPEGIAFDADSTLIFVVDEYSGEVITLDTIGNEISRFKVEVGNFLPKHGLEGITVNTANGNLLLVSEKFPGLLIEVTRTGEEISRHTLNFAMDYSSVFFDPHTHSLWVLSDESQSLTLCTLTGIPIQTWRTGLKKGEGVVIDSKNELIYIVTDNDSGLYVFKLKL